MKQYIKSVFPKVPDLNERNGKNEMKEKKTWLGVLCVVLASVLWGSVGLAVRMLTDAGLTSIDILEIRSIIALIFTGLFMLIFCPQALKINIKDIWCFLGTGILNMMVQGLCYFYCIKATSLAVAGAFCQTGPMFAIVFGCILFKERFTLKKLAAMVLTFSGCLLASRLTGSEALSFIGVILGLGTGIGYSMYSVFGRYAINKGYEPMTITFYSFLICGICAAFVTDWGAVAGSVSADPKVLIWMILIGLGVGFGGYVLYTKGLQNIETGTASILCSIELVTATLIGVTVYGEILTAPVLIGLILIIAGIVITNVELPKAAKEGKDV